MRTRRQFFKTVGIGAAAIAGGKLLRPALAEDAAQEPLAPKSYRIGIAPSHITVSPEALFTDESPWRSVRDRIDLYKYYGVQLAPTKWATKLPCKPFADFAGRHDIAIGCEFGNFGLGKRGSFAADAVEAAVRQHKPIFDAGGKVASMHLDGPVRRVLKGPNKSPQALTLEQAAAGLADFHLAVHKLWPEMEIGLITNFPNWDYTKELPGFNGHWTDSSGVTYHEAVSAVHEAVGKAGDRIAFVEVDCPFGYYKRTRTRNNDAPVDNRRKFLAIQKWCEARKIKFHVIVNNEVPRPAEGGQWTAAQQAEADRAFHDGTLDYIRRLRQDGVFPDLFLIQSWYVAPAEHIPESKKHTFMNTVREAIDLIEELYPRKRPKANCERKETKTQ
jgi:hypothetical protein